MAAVIVAASMASVATTSAAGAGHAARVGHRAGAASVPYGTRMDIDMVSATVGYALNSDPAMNSGGFQVPPSVLLSTADGGTHWAARRFPSSVIVAAISFPRPRLGWAAAFDNSAGNAVILHTTDGGRDWQAQTLPSDGSAGQLNDITFADTLHGWAVGFSFIHGGPLVVQTSDGGATWSVPALPSAPRNSLLSAVSFSDSLNGWATGDRPGTFVLHTADGGANWTQQTVPSNVTELDDVSAVGGDAWAVGGTGNPAAGVILESAGGGAWQAQTAPSTIAMYAIAMANPRDGWATALDASAMPVALRTVDGGSTWSATSTLALTVPSDVAAISGADALVIGNGGCPGAATILQTSDRGASWTTRLAMPAPLAQLNGLSFPDAGNGWTTATACGSRVLHSTDHGAAWIPVAPFATSVQAWDLTFISPHRGWVLADDQAGWLVESTTDGGQSWTPRALPTGFLPSGNPGSISFDATHGWVLGVDSSFNAAVARSNDGGQSWSTQSIPGGFFLNALTAAGSVDVWAVGSNGSGSATIVASQDGGVTWSPQPVPSGIANLQSVVFVDAHDGWAGGSDSSGNGVIVATTDGGAHWTQQTVPTVNGISDVSFSPARAGWALAGSSLLHLANDGTTWTPVAPPQVPASVDRLAAVESTSVVVLGTTAFAPAIADNTSNGASWQSAAIFDPAWITIAPSSGPPASTVTVSGHGFDPGEDVSIRWSSPTGTELTAVAADSTGAFSAAVTVPAAAAGGHRVYAVGQLSLAAPYARFVVT